VRLKARYYIIEPDKKLFLTHKFNLELFLETFTSTAIPVNVKLLL